MKNFRKRPVVIQAVQVNDDNYKALREIEQADGDRFQIWMRTTEDSAVTNYIHSVKINTLEGEMVGDYGDWIIRGVKNELYPCKPDIFEATYDPID